MEFFPYCPHLLMDYYIIEGIMDQILNIWREKDVHLLSV